MRIIAVLNQKGGVGKTTTVANVTAGLARRGKRVLAIDLDPQSNLTTCLGAQLTEGQPTIYEVLLKRTDLESAIVQAEGVDLIPATIDLSGADIDLMQAAKREERLKQALRAATDYDYIFIDCPPSLGLLTINALTAAQEVFLPLQAEYLAMLGVATLISTVDMIRREGLNENLEITGVIPTRYNSQKKLSQEVVDRISKQFGERMFKTVIRENVKLSEAQAHNTSIFSYDSESNGAKDYAALCDEIISRESV